MTSMRTVRVIALALAAVVLPAVAAAQTSSTATSPTTAGAFDRLSGGNQKIARALFEAQDRSTTPGTTRLTLDQIAAMKSGKGEGGWGRAFKAMKERGLVEEKNLGQVVSRHERDDKDRGKGRDKDRVEKDRRDKDRVEKDRHDKDRVEKDRRDKDRDDRPGRAEHRERPDRDRHGSGRGR